MERIVSGARYEPDARAIPARENADAVVFEFMNPTGTARWSLGGGGETRLDNPETGAGTLTQRHGHLIGTETGRVESVPPGKGHTTQ